MERFSIIALLYLLCFGLIKITEAQTVTQPTCTEFGTFEIYDGTCKNYYLCISDGEKLNPVMLKCSMSAIFNTTVGACLPADEENMCQQTTISPPTTQAPCVRYGRFPINDINCKRYYLCYWDGVRYTKMDNLQCSKTLIFNPTSQKCVLPQTYICPIVQE